VPESAVVAAAVAPKPRKKTARKRKPNKKVIEVTEG
jgi:hypothetical protein